MSEKEGNEAEAEVPPAAAAVASAEPNAAGSLWDGLANVEYIIDDDSKKYLIYRDKFYIQILPWGKKTPSMQIVRRDNDQRYILLQSVGVYYNKYNNDNILRIKDMLNFYSIVIKNLGYRIGGKFEDMDIVKVFEERHQLFEDGEDGEVIHIPFFRKRLQSIGNTVNTVLQSYKRSRERVNQPGGVGFLQAKKEFEEYLHKQEETKQSNDERYRGIAQRLLSNLLF